MRRISILCGICLLLAGLGLYGQQFPPDLNNNWSRPDSITQYEGEDLFFLINGGAEVYLEYGFGKVMAADYYQRDAKIHTELYHMKDPLAAWGVFSLRKPKPASFSEDLGWYSAGSNYLMVMKNDIYLVLSGYDKSDELFTFAKHILKEIPLCTSNQADCSFIRDSLSVHDIIFLRGPLALANIYRFGQGLFRKFSEGYSWHNRPAQMEILLRYDSENDLWSDFDAIGVWLEKSSQFKLKSTQENIINLTGPKGDDIRIQSYQPHEIRIFIQSD